MREINVPVRIQKTGKAHNRLRLRAGLCLAAGLLLLTVFARQIAPCDPYEQDMSAILLAPGGSHLLGTDRFGRDMLSRVLVGGQTSIFSALLLVAFISVFGTAAGLLCGFYGGKVDTILMRVSDVFLAFPGLVLALAIAAILGGGMGSAVLALALVSWPKYSRLARSRTLAEKESVYVQAARLASCSDLQLIVRHILPNILGPILVTAVLDIGTMMMELAGLSFLGLGAQPPAAEWGNMMSSGRSMLLLYPWLVLAPGFAIFITVVIFNLLGDAVRDYLEKKE